MKFDTSFPQRVALTRNSLGMTQAELASHVGIVQRQIAAYEGGEAKPREKVLGNLAAALGTTPEWLSHGEGLGPVIGIARRTVTVREIPLLSNQDYALMLMQGGDAAPISGYIPAPIECSDKAFAVRITGDSMLSSTGPSFPDGCIVTFDPETSPKSGDFVLVISSYESSRIRFKKIIFEGNNHILISLNSDEHPPELVTNPDILATAIHMQYDILGNSDYHQGGAQLVSAGRCQSKNPTEQSELLKLLRETRDLLIERRKKDQDFGVDQHYDDKHK